LIVVYAIRILNYVIKSLEGRLGIILLNLFFSDIILSNLFFLILASFAPEQYFLPPTHVPKMTALAPTITSSHDNSSANLRADSKGFLFCMSHLSGGKSFPEV
jgi:hypothetical protein